uniref:Bestrophin homolog n=1 Tax=Strigamia maritima TaxID=126957 RepID=T1JF97_STRMM
MTVSYTAEVATCRGFGCFWQLLFRWRGSIYKLLWPELIVYIVCYYSLSIIYRLVLEDENKRNFEKIARYCNTYADLIPVTFILGFYISMVLKRWWDQFVSIPWPDALALFVSASIHGQDDRGRLMRRTIMRYVNLSLVMTLRCISPRVKKRFPTLDHLQEAVTLRSRSVFPLFLELCPTGILLQNEKKIIEELNLKTPQYPKHWMPLVWASSVVTRARKEGRILDDFAVKTLIDELSTFRGQCGGLFIYDWISIPLVVTLAVYTFFFATVMGRQYLDPAQGYRYHEIDLYIPVFTFLQFFFYMGWLKVIDK